MGNLPINQPIELILEGIIAGQGRDTAFQRGSALPEKIIKVFFLFFPVNDLNTLPTDLRQ
jgi:hypothetical protein